MKLAFDFGHDFALSTTVGHRFDGVVPAVFPPESQLGVEAFGMLFPLQARFACGMRKAFDHIAVRQGSNVGDAARGVYGAAKAVVFCKHRQQATVAHTAFSTAHRRASEQARDDCAVGAAHASGRARANANVSTSKVALNCIHKTNVGRT